MDMRHISDEAIKARAKKDARYGVYRGDRLPHMIRRIYDATIQAHNSNLWRTVNA